ncbi:MAG TPA: RDD family protein [candidate division Zixibacteria bacterium]|nr:RDD family protein [candidate division Zixibacteria bacterium]
MSEYRYVGLWPRFAALVIDFIALSLVFFPVTRLVKGTWMMTAADHRWSYGLFITDPLCLIFLVVIMLYFVLTEGLVGGTIGKRLLRIKVIDPQGNVPGPGRSLIRNLLRIVDALPVLNLLGVWLIVRSTERARFGDRIAGTRVVNRD